MVFHNETGTFRVKVAKRATPFDFYELSESQRQALGNGINYDENLHRVIQVCALIDFLVHPGYRKRTSLRKSFRRADQLILYIRIPSANWQIVGILPLSQPAGEEGSSETVGEIKLELTPPVMGKLSLGGGFKNQARRRKHAILAAHTDQEAQWVFLKPYLEAHTDYCVTLLLKGNAVILDTPQYLTCTISVKERGREIEGAYNRKIAFN
jgi:hypothetical protein